MTIVLTIIHVFVCLFLIVVILLQAGKGADMGAIFGGGGAQTLFGASGGATFMSKATTVLAAVFMLTCLSLAILSSRSPSIMPAGDEAAGATAPAPSADDTAPAKEGTTEPAPPAEQPSSPTAAPAEEGTPATPAAVPDEPQEE